MGIPEAPPYLIYSLPCCTCFCCYRRDVRCFFNLPCLTASLLMLGADVWYKLGMEWKGREWERGRWGKEVGIFPFQKPRKCNSECRENTKELSGDFLLLKIHPCQKNSDQVIHMLPIKSVCELRVQAKEVNFTMYIHLNIILKAKEGDFKMYIQLSWIMVTDHQGNSKTCLSEGRMFLEFTCSSHIQRKKRKRQINILPHVRDIPQNRVN